MLVIGAAHGGVSAPVVMSVEHRPNNTRADAGVSAVGAGVIPRFLSAGLPLCSIIKCIVSLVWFCFNLILDFISFSFIGDIHPFLPFTGLFHSVSGSLQLSGKFAVNQTGYII